jgi:hypothetical protein
LIISNILSESAFGLDLYNFLTSNEVIGKSKSSAARITLKELTTRGFKAHYGRTENEWQLAWKNIQNNWLSVAGGLIGVPIAFKLGKKVLAKQVIRPLNKGLKMAGLGTDVKV